ncbi:MAG: ArnT family glycosyltransferase [Actinomycetota bacterium]
MTNASGSPPRARQFWGRLLVIAFIALLVRIAFVVTVDPDAPDIGDASAYHLLANNLADGRGYIRPFDYSLLGIERATAEYPPLFPAALAVPSLAGADSIDAHRVFLAVIGAGTAVLVGLLGRRVAGKRAGLIAAALAACWPMLFLSEAIVMAEAIYAPLVTAAILGAYRALDAPTPARFAALGVVLGLATLTRTEGLLLAVVLVVAICTRLRGVDVRHRMVAATLALSALIVVVAPWTVRNAIRLDAFVPVSTNAATLVDGANCDPVYSGRQLGLWRETFSQFGDAARTHPQSEACFEGFAIADPGFEEAEVAKRHLRAGAGYARDHVGSLPKIATVRILRTWGVYAPGQQIDFESLEGRPRAWQRAGTTMHWFALPFAIAGIVICVRLRVPIGPLLAPIIAVTAVAAATYGQQRFRVAAEPVILVAAAVGMSELARSTRFGRATHG